MKIFAAFLIGALAVSFSLTGSNQTHPDLQRVSEITTISPASEPLVYLFQILFILFIISPPLIVLLLFLIWRELKTSNKLK